ncbi:MAG: hypothetical protein L0H84_24310, partial [Pseudonocardia sp.]|nr:hypothetical protein [Pseudonocardia sp.]
MTVIDAGQQVDPRVKAVVDDVLAALLDVMTRHRVTWAEEFSAPTVAGIVRDGPTWVLATPLGTARLP